ncbi:unnamed protein product [Paramecium sonneborni]|uniref:Uncharacterized protein n=1 Tax=Paramecium sonneborni TaxID=65129 RepID=A0A8S1RQS5_9CILI|nr:unnamed protein product [Paramecium sonneborni]
MKIRFKLSDGYEFYQEQLQFQLWIIKFRFQKARFQ